MIDKTGGFFFFKIVTAGGIAVFLRLAARLFQPRLRRTSLMCVTMRETATGRVRTIAFDDV